MIIPGYYEYCNRVKVVSGHSVLESIPQLLSDLSSKSPLVITDKGVSNVGLVDIALGAMNRNDLPVFDNVPPDSDLKTIREIAQLYRAKHCDSIIAIGGGSVIDTAKGVNVLVSLGGDNLMQFAGAGKVKTKLKPLIVVPTTSGTGSEVTLAAVIADHERSVKLGFVSYNLLPNIAILDSRMTQTLPPHLTALTGMDALTHTCEAYTCLSKNPLSDGDALLAIRLISNNILKSIANPNDLDARLALAHGSTLAGAAFSNSMVGMVHSLGHATGGVCQAPHGTCMSIILPYGLEYNFKKVEHLIADLLFPLAGEKVFASTPKELRARRAIQFIRELNQKLYNATNGRHARYLSEIKDREGNMLVPREKLPEIAKTAMGDGAQFYNPEDLDFNDFLMVLEHAWEGKPLGRN
ncbi:MAG: iron-containing alcohol dehydrogenase [Tenuifilaceae bacterium]|jgi:alcohol dehydrogenase|nr:iron-containing alcohol dehydrogenase [Tenuifilaceae bacterium]